MTPSEAKQLAVLNLSLSKEIHIELIRTPHAHSPVIIRFCRELVQQVPKIRVKEEEGDPGELPAIRIHRGLQYQAAPAGTEVGPFIEALQLKDSGAARLQGSTAASLSKIDLPTYLVIYVSPRCKFCPGAVRQLLPLPTLNDNIRLTVVDALHFPEVANRDNIQSVPTLIVEDRFRWTGTFQTDEVVEVMVKRDPSFLGPASLEMMLKEGRAGQLAAMMLEKGEIFPAFYPLLTHAKWPVRLGAMVVMETLIENNLDLALRTIKPLWLQFPKVDDRVKGDLLYMLGQMGQKEIAPRLEKVLDGDYEEEVKEAAREALDKLNS